MDNNMDSFLHMVVVVHEVLAGHDEVDRHGVLVVLLVVASLQQIFSTIQTACRLRNDYLTPKSHILY